MKYPNTQSHSRAAGRALAVATALAAALAATPALAATGVAFVHGTGHQTNALADYWTAEMVNSVRQGLPIICVISNNHGWRDVSHEQDMWFGAGRRVASELSDCRYDLMAEAFGGHGEHVTTLEELRPVRVILGPDSTSEGLAGG